MSISVDITTNRAQKNWSGRTQFARVLWALTLPLFRLSPRPLWQWRVWLLRRFGGVIGTGVHIYPTVKITMPWHLTIGDQTAVGDGATLYALGRIDIGARATISQNAHLCAGTHDRRDPARPLVKAPIQMGSDAWVCADAFVGPGVTIGAGAILGARSVAMKTLPADHIGVGNPMQIREAT